LLEETGYTTRRLLKLLHIIPTPGFVQEWMWIFAAEGLAEGLHSRKKTRRSLREHSR